MFRLAETAVEHPDELVRLQELVREAEANERAFQAGPYHVAQLVLKLLPADVVRLGDRVGVSCNSIAYRPVMQALTLLGRYADVDGKTRFCDAGETALIEGVVPKARRDAVVDKRRRVGRTAYELCVQAAVRPGEVYVGGKRWCNPDDAGCPPASATRGR